MARRKKLVADLLCGAGGTTAGAREALDALGHGVEFVCLNHCRTAIATHTLNFPTARHYVQDIAAARPIEVVPEGYLDLLMASPTCTHHSRARGGKPTSDQQRSDPWHIITWLTELRVHRLLIENVPEFRDWGPVDMRTGRPMKSRKGEYFRAWLDAIKRLGFRCEYRILNAADYGAATTRQRFYLLARSDRGRLVFPMPTHAREASFDVFGERQRWRAAREIIDWGRDGRSIFTRKRALADKTMARIEAGARKFKWPEPFLVILRQHMDARSLDEPLPTVTATGTHIGIAERSLTPFVLAQAAGGAPRGVEDPMPTIVAGGAVSVTQPILISVTGGDKPKSAKAVDDPLGTVTTRNGVGIADPFVFPVNQGNERLGGQRSVDQPMPTIVTRDSFGIAEPMISPYYGSGSGETCKAIDKPLDTVTAKARFGVVEPVAEPFILPQQGDEEGRPPRVRDVQAPLPTVTTVSRIGVVDGSVKPFLAAHFGERDGQAPRVHDVDHPFPTVTHRGAGDLVEGVATPLVVQTDQTGGRGGYVRSAEDPIYPPVTKQNQALIEPIVQAMATDDDLRAAVEQGRVFMVDGVPHIFDIRFRMLEPYELARAMGFDDEYRFVGNKTEVTRQIGNAVERNQARALVTALFEGDREERAPAPAHYITGEAAE